MNNIFFYFSLSFLFSLIFSLFSAAPITHLYLANEWQKIIYSFEGKNKEAFQLGNLFPDIRYLGEVSRASTHETNVTLDSIFTSPPFLAGMRLHAFIDEEREALVLKWKVYDYIKEWGKGHEATLLKLVEDEILYNQINLILIRQALDSILEEELMQGIAYTSVQKWHTFLKYYLSFPPSHLLKQLAQKKQPYFQIPAETICLWSQLLPILAQKPELIDYVDNLSKAFSEKFQLFLCSEKI